MDLHTFAFAAPARLWALALLAGLLLAAAALLRHRARTAEPFADAALLPSVAPHRAGWRRPAAAAGLVLATVVLTSAWAQPQVMAEEASERAVVVVALDTSSSMLATDVAPDRFTAAKQAAQAFVRDLPEQVDVGLVAYNANAKVVVAPTSEHEQVAAAVDTLSMSGGTAMGDALTLSLRSVLSTLQSTDASSAARIVLLSDGDSTAGSPVPAAVAAATDAGVPVSTIAYGTADGVVVANGTTYRVPVDTALLEQVASGTGGTAYTATSLEQLRDVYDDIGTQLVEDTRREDVADLFAGLGAVLLLATAVPSLVLSSRLVLV